MSYDDRPGATDLDLRPAPPPADALAGDARPTQATPTTVAPLTTTPPPAKASPAGRAVRELVETLLLALLIFMGVRLVVLNFRVDGLSMFPNLHDREMLLVNRNAYHFDLNSLWDVLPGLDDDDPRILFRFDPPERGDIVVFDPPEEPDPDKPYIKRVIGLPGETVTFRNGDVFINGQLLDEPYIDDGITECGRGEECQVTVEEGQVFVLGDNRNNSSDSRAFGPVEVDQIIGKAWFSYWPMDEVGLVPHYDYPDMPEGPVAGGGQDGAAGLAATPGATTTRAERPHRADRTPRADRVPRPKRTPRAGPTPEVTP